MIRHVVRTKTRIMARELKRYTRCMHLILFDIDGTLIGGQGVGRLAIQRAFGEVFERDMAAYPKVADVHFAGSSFNSGWSLSRM